MKNTSSDFLAASQRAMHDPQLQTAMAMLATSGPALRSQAVAAVSNFESLRDYVVAMKDHTLDYLDDYLQQFEEQLAASGGEVHHAATGDDLNRIVTDICRRHDARQIVKSKSMVGEETDLNDALERAGMQVLETDMGEYIIQLAHEHPSHILGPAVHKTKEQVRDLFLKHHDLGERSLESPEEIVREARGVLRDRFLEADVGISGTNCLIAETGSVTLVTNEGNGDLCATLPRVHIVIAGMEKIVPTPEDASAVIRVLARSAVGQSMAAYTTFHTGPRREDDSDGPDEFHVILLDNGRRSILNGKYRDMLRCIRCGACLNHCPIYRHVGGHAYGWVYPGPMGSVLTPLLTQMDKARHLPNACTACGRCEEVCPVRIPLPDLLRELRDDLRTQGAAPVGWRYLIAVMMRALRYPRLYYLATAIAAPIIKLLSRHQRLLQSLPIVRGWAGGRRLPAPQGRSFLQQERKRKKHPARIN
jgi:L-lactate dehydrogenase complex protein LldF